jgi:hypothetical protein
LGQRKGAVLIIVLGVLAVLALLAVTFSTLQGTERQIAHNYMDTVRAKLLAQSGVQDAEAKLREYFPGRYFNTVNVRAPKPWKYWGQDPTETIEPPVNDDIQYALNPSFAIEADPLKNVAENPQDPTDSNVNPKRVSIEGKMCGLSGYQGGTYAQHGDQYVLRVNDTSGRLYVNDGVDGTPNGKMNSVSRNMRRILNVLGDVLQSANLGSKIIENRPAAGYQSMQDVLKALNYDQALFDKIKNYITVYAWVDNNVVNPVPLNAQVAAQFQGLTGVTFNRGSAPSYRAGSEIQGLDSAGKELNYGLDYMQNGGDVKRLEVRLFGLDALNPQHIEVVARAPVNVNAASEEVITALLTGLQGFFITDRKRNAPRWEGDLYLAFKMQFKYYPESISRGDEIGFLVDTFPIVNSTGTGTNGISARRLAKEIVACRNGDRSTLGGWSYNPKGGGGKWFGGPFRSWHQFNAFIDFLARAQADGGAGFLVDQRQDIFKDYEEEGVDPMGFGGLVPSDLQRDYANQAIADVIKANFNPNCHLNELNPDANLFLVVDKTDLFINSTEFCFMPTGYFEVESLGRVLRPRSPKEQDAYLGDNEIAAQSKVTATLKLYDMYRESTQKQFYAGSLSPQSSNWGTNNDKSIEIGPEPDNGYFPGNLQNAGREPADNEWDGYLALPTMGGVFGGSHGAADKQPNTLSRTMGLGKSPHLGAVMHVHFTLDHDAHDHPGDPSEIGCQKMMPINREVYNYGDYVKGQGILGYGGPYNPTKGQPGYHRLAKSYRMNPDPKSGTVPQVNLSSFAPSDLRIDGAYVERHAAPAYYNMINGQGVWDFDLAPAQGLISFWWKPSYAPERTGKIRSMFDMGRSHARCDANVHIWPFALWFYPAQYNPGTSENTKPLYWSNNMGKFNPCSLNGGSKQWHDGNNQWFAGLHEFGRQTVCLNHLGHADHKWSQPSPLQAHRWMNTSFMWNLSVGDDGTGQKTCKIYVNGSESYTKYDYTNMTGFTSGHAAMVNFNKHDGGAFNHIRLGGTSMVCTAAKGLANECNSYRGDYTGDHTIDEFYAWNKGAGDPLILWQGSRYYRPTGAGATGGMASQGRFLSQALTTMVPYAQRVLAPPSNTPAPGGVVAVAGGTQTAEPPTLRVLGMSWTWYGELPDHRLNPWAQWDGTRLLYDYNGAGAGEAGMPVRNLDVKVGAGIDDGGQIYGPFYDDGFSTIVNTRSRIPSIQDPTKLKYYVQIEIPGGGKPILLASPVVDDVTLYWDDNQSHLLSYVFDNRSF